MVDIEPSNTVGLDSLGTFSGPPDSSTELSANGGALDRSISASIIDSLPRVSKKPVRRTSAQNPYNDYVKGVKRGNESYRMFSSISDVILADD